MKKTITTALLVAIGMFYSQDALSQRKKSKNKEEVKSALPAMPGMAFRSIGPALTSGRISDFAVHPEDRSTYYVATSAGGVWKTENAGITFTPLFDQQGSYSIGVVTMDPNNHDVIWVGTGENNNQRSVAYGDGVYKSVDGGNSWKHMGLKNSEHIGSIVVDPRDSDVVYVAAIGPLWNAGGERGLYKTTDGGETWNRVLNISEHTGINEVHMDPRNPDILYASAHQRRRHVFTYISGGPESGLHRSMDGGETWEEINNGLPNVDLGRIGLDISPANPDIIYAIVEAADGKGGFYRSTNQGSSWEKRGGHSTSGNYYQEIIAHPTNPDVVYSMDTWMSVTRDGGKSFQNVGEKWKHVDNHALYIDPEHPSYLLSGCDGGIYESFDAGQTWRFMPNLPVTQFYKVEVDNSKPFYYVYGGTQDNFSLGGPSQTTSENGITNSDWFITNGGDGFESAIDPEDPNIVYAQSQYGYLVRYDRSSGESIGIKPKEDKGEDAYRWNWDAPLFTSKHVPGRIYFAANKVFRSDDRGNSWTKVSEDLTQQIDRNKLKVMGRVWSVDAVAKNQSTSPYGTIVAFSESPLDQNLLAAGTDDGLIQVTENGGDNWRKISTVSGAPERSYVNMVLFSQHDRNTLYAVYNHHKYGDFKPYIFKSTDLGRSWVNLSGTLPERGSTYAIAEDHEDKDLLFAGTEFGAFYSKDGGTNWNALKAGLPTVAVRDLAIQEEENDLVLATFGRGFYVLDDYSILRETTDELFAKDAHLFSVDTSMMFVQRTPLGLPGKGFQGASHYYAENPEVGATFTYFIKEGFTSAKDKRMEAERKSRESMKDVYYPSYDQLKAEQAEEKPSLMFIVYDNQDNIVRKLTAPVAAGVQRITWDLRYPSVNPIELNPASSDNPFIPEDKGILVAPGIYKVGMFRVEGDQMQELSEPVSFVVQQLPGSTLPATDREGMLTFQRELSELQRALTSASSTIQDVEKRLKYLRAAVLSVSEPGQSLMEQWKSIEKEIASIKTKMYGDQLASQLDIDTPPSIANRVYGVIYDHYGSTSDITETQKQQFRIAKEEFVPVLNDLKQLVNEDLAQLEDALEDAGAPYTPGRLPDYSEN
ncbi:WD40/YVTN/BNR-like repeat-containing protein [Roseivirga sp. BDSF3-8]|uniref:WD40/YVTN/BNR-like repeat-containing protein n=1 Tax=Roseivirga sp. BDSF3-8 TaxID=3241598 RepID=UPI003531C6AD